MPPTLNDLITWAKGAGEILRAGYNETKTIRYKGTVDLVTQYDHLSEEYLIGQIRSHFPQDSIIAEESGLHAGNGGGQWYVDPLDGTVNYAHGLPIFCVSLAYGEDGEVKLGVEAEKPRGRKEAAPGEGRRHVLRDDRGCVACR